MASIYQEYLIGEERDIEIDIARANARYNRCAILLEMVALQEQQMKMDAELKVLSESGTYDDLEYLYTEAEEETAEKKRSLLGNLIDAIVQFFVGIARKIKSFFSKKDPEEVVEGDENLSKQAGFFSEIASKLSSVPALLKEGKFGEAVKAASPIWASALGVLGTIGGGKLIKKTVSEWNKDLSLVQNVQNIFTGIGNGILSFFQKKGKANTEIDATGDVGTDVPKDENGIAAWFMKIINWLKEKIKAIVDAICNIVKKAKDKVAGAINNLKNKKNGEGAGENGGEEGSGETGGEAQGNGAETNNATPANAANRPNTAKLSSDNRYELYIRKDPNSGQNVPVLYNVSTDKLVSDLGYIAGKPEWVNLLKSKGIDVAQLKNDQNAPGNAPAPKNDVPNKAAQPATNSQNTQQNTQQQSTQNNQQQNLQQKIDSEAKKFQQQGAANSNRPKNTNNPNNMPGIDPSKIRVREDPNTKAVVAMYVTPSGKEMDISNTADGKKAIANYRKAHPTQIVASADTYDIPTAALLVNESSIFGDQYMVKDYAVIQEAVGAPIEYVGTFVEHEDGSITEVNLFDDVVNESTDDFTAGLDKLVEELFAE